MSADLLQTCFIAGRDDLGTFDNMLCRKSTNCAEQERTDSEELHYSGSMKPIGTLSA
jgi:hypothetical protein